MYVDRLSSVMYDHFIDMGFVSVMCRRRLRCVVIPLIWARIHIIDVID